VFLQRLEKRGDDNCVKGSISPLTGLLKLCSIAGTALYFLAMREQGKTVVAAVE
jgi:hypothetical protein